MRTKAQQIEGIRADKQFWRDLAAEVGPERYGEPGAMGEWTFGDLAGHLLGWRNRSARWSHPRPIRGTSRSRMLTA